MRLILLIVYYFIITPISILFRLFRIQMLDIDWNKSQKSYWNLIDKKNDKKRNK